MPAAGRPPVDRSDWYFTDEEDMGEGGEQLFIIRALVSCLAELGRERGWRDVLIGADQFFAWVEHEPLVRVSPDIYLLEYIPKRPLPASWQTWLPGHRPPTLALGIGSDEGWAKDYRDNPAKYAQLGGRKGVRNLLWSVAWCTRPAHPWGGLISPTPEEGFLMKGVVFEHMPVAELPAAWRPKLAKATGATVTVRIEEEARTAAPAEEFVTDDPAFGIWRDREDMADAAAYVRKIRQPSRPA